MIGSSAVSLGVLLGTFMGGMCLGSLLLPRLVSASWHPLRVYARWNWGSASACRPGAALRSALSRRSVCRHLRCTAGWAFSSRAWSPAVCLLPPTILMGATLPAIARWVEATPQGISWLGFFYGGNIAGAVLGCLLAGFYLLRVYDMAVATYVAAAINAHVAAGALLIAQRIRIQSRQSNSAPLTDACRRPFRNPQSEFRTCPWSICVSPSPASARSARSRLDAALVAADRRHRLYVLDHPGRVPDRPGPRQQLWLRSRPRARAPRLALGVCQLLLAAAIAWSAYHAGAIAPLLADRPVAGTQTSGTTFSSTCSAACGPSCRPPASGARAFRWRWPAAASLRESGFRVQHSAPR